MDEALKTYETWTKRYLNADFMREETYKTYERVDRDLVSSFGAFLYGVLRGNTLNPGLEDHAIMTVIRTGTEHYLTDAIRRLEESEAAACQEPS
jgi:hypothetical protein